MGLILTPILVLIYTRINAKRDAIERESGGVRKYSDAELRRLGDRAPDFRYSL